MECFLSFFLIPCPFFSRWNIFYVRRLFVAVCWLPFWIISCIWMNWNKRRAWSDPLYSAPSFFGNTGADVAHVIRRTGRYSRLSHDVTTAIFLLHTNCPRWYACCQATSERTTNNSESKAGFEPTTSVTPVRVCSTRTPRELEGRFYQGVSST